MGDRELQIYGRGMRASPLSPRRPVPSTRLALASGAGGKRVYYTGKGLHCEKSDRAVPESEEEKLQLHRNLRTHPPPHPARHPHRHPARPDHPAHRLPTLDPPPPQPPKQRTAPHGRHDLRHRNRQVMQAHDRAGLPLHARQLFRILILVAVVVRVS